MANDWYFQVMGQEQGPVSAKELKKLAATGTVTADTFVRYGEQAEWVLADRVHGLFEKSATGGAPRRPPTGVKVGRPPPTAVAGSASNSPDNVNRTEPRFPKVIVVTFLVGAYLLGAVTTTVVYFVLWPGIASQRPSMKQTVAMQPEVSPAAAGHNGKPAPLESRRPQNIEPSAGSQQPVAPSTQPPPETPKESAKVQAFKEKVGHYLEEARAGAKLLAMTPTIDQAKTKSEQITDLYTHLPNVPSEIDSTGELAQKLKEINGSFFAGLEFVKARIGFERLGAPDNVKEVYKDCQETTDSINKVADEIESWITRWGN